jgi:hypothetical protein
MNRRRAVSLVELLLTMSACTVILTMSTALIHRVLHAQSKTRAFVDCERAALRLSEQFRRDVHAARDATTADANLGEGVFLRLQFPTNQSVEYRHSQGAVLRVLLENGATPSREEFVFPANIELSVRQEPPGLVALSITSQPGKAAAEDGQPQSSAYAVTVSLQAEARLNRTPGITGSRVKENDSP